MAKRTDVYYWSQSLTYKTLAGGNFTRGYYIKVGVSGSARITDVNTTTKILAVNGVSSSSLFVDGADVVEYSDAGLTSATGVTAKEDGAFTSSWIGPEANQVKVRIEDTFLKPKFAEITLADFDQNIQNRGIYSAYKRVKIEDITPSKPIFFGRVEYTEVQNQEGGTFLILQCKDFLSEIEEGIIGHNFAGPNKLGDLVKDIVDYHTFTKITYDNLAGGTFTVSEYDNAGYWVAVYGTSASVLQEYFNTGDDTANSIYGVNWSSQKFTVTDAHTITKVKLLLYRTGSPGTITVGIRAVDGSILPTGADLCAGTTSGNTLPTGAPYEWREVTFTVPLALSKGVTYAIVVRATSGDGSNYVSWRADTSTDYSIGATSGDSGVTWANYTGKIFMFEEYETTDNSARARIIYDDTANKTLVLTDVLQAENFVNDAPLKEYSDENCTTLSGVTADQNGSLTHNIDTSSIGSVGTIDVRTASNYLKSSKNALETIESLCLNASSDGIYSFFLDIGSGASLYPPVFTLFARESRPSGGASANGLTVKFNGTAGNQQRQMQVDYSFPLPNMEIYTEVTATSVDTSDATLTSTKKSGLVALDLEICKPRVYQSVDHASQAGLNSSVNNIMSAIGQESIQRANVTCVYYPYFSIGGVYTVVHAGELINIYNSRVNFAASGIDMVVTKIAYEEPTGTTRIELKEKEHGLGVPEYTYPNTTVGTSYPPTVDVRIPTISDVDWEEIIPLSIQGYQHNITFTATDYRTIAITAGDITFYDHTIQAVNWIGAFGNTTCTLSTTGSPYPTQYIYFDLDNAQPNVAWVGSVSDYTAALVAHPGRVGLLCISRANATISALAAVIPSYGKEPLISCDMIEMSSVQKYNYGTDADPRFINSLLRTQVSAGKILLSADTTISGGGVEMAPSLASTNWTVTGGWSATGATLERVYYFGLDDATPSGAGATPVAGVTYQVIITASNSSANIEFTYGGSALQAIPVGTTTYSITAVNTNKLFINGMFGATATITSISIRVAGEAWYAQTGVIMNASYGVAIYGSNLSFATFAALSGGSYAYEDFLVHMKAGRPDLAVAHCQCYVGTDGKISAGGGNVTLSATGIETIGEYAIWSVIAGTAIGIIKAIDSSPDYFLIGTKNSSPMHIAAPGSTIYFDNNIDFSGVTATGSISGKSGEAGTVTLTSTTGTLYVLMANATSSPATVRYNSGLTYVTSTDTINANCSGSSGSCTGNSATVTVGGTSSTGCYVGLFESSSGSLSPKTDADLTYNASTGTLTTCSIYPASGGNYACGSASLYWLSVTAGKFQVYDANNYINLSSSSIQIVSNGTLLANVGASELLVTTTGALKGINIENSSTGNEGAVIILNQKSGSPAADDALGQITFWGNDSLAANGWYGGMVYKITSATSGAKTGRYEWWSMDGAGARKCMNLASTGVLSVDVSGSTGSYANVDLYDEYDDAIVLKESIQKKNREKLVEMGIFDKKNDGSGYMMKIQPMINLLAGGIYQTREKLDEMNEKNKLLEEKVKVLERKLLTDSFGDK